MAHNWQVALSVAEAEYMELAETAKQAAWLRSFSQEIGTVADSQTPPNC